MSAVILNPCGWSPFDGSFRTNTQARYETAITNATARPTDLTLLKEISVSIKVDVVSSGSWTTKRVTVSDVLYRTQLARRLSRGLPCVRAETPGAGTCSTALVYQRQKCHPS